MVFHQPQYTVCLCSRQFRNRSTMPCQFQLSFGTRPALLHKPITVSSKTHAQRLVLRAVSPNADRPLFQLHGNQQLTLDDVRYVVLRTNLNAEYLHCSGHQDDDVLLCVLVCGMGCLLHVARAEQCVSVSCPGCCQHSTHTLEQHAASLRACS